MKGELNGRIDEGQIVARLANNEKLGDNHFDRASTAFGSSTDIQLEIPYIIACSDPGRS